MRENGKDGNDINLLCISYLTRLFRVKKMFHHLFPKAIRLDLKERKKEREERSHIVLSSSSSSSIIDFTSTEIKNDSSLDSG